MFPIILEGAMFVALLATAGALVLWGVWHATPLGRVTRQLQNRRRLQRAADLDCPIHGMQAADQMVRLSDGTRVCPACFQETNDGKLD
jgi:hypothetical protein